MLLVGVSALTMRMLGGALGEECEVSAVPFPSPAFDRAVETFSPDVVIVDVTYLDESRVRPLILDRFEGQAVAVLFRTETGWGWLDDLRTRRSGPFGDPGPEAIRSLCARPSLKLVEP